jgi:DNA-binding NtrC family response regulator
MFGDAREHLSQKRFWVVVIEFGSQKQRVGDVEPLARVYAQSFCSSLDVRQSNIENKHGH